MITDEQARDIRSDLFEELEKNGFGVVAREAIIRLQEDSEEMFFEGKDEVFQKINSLSEKDLLTNFLSEVIDILGNLSNDDYEGLIDKFNEYTTAKSGKINSIFVEVINQEEPYDLKKLPSYRPIIQDLKKIQIQIMEGN